jgi:hypothetical protein
LKRTSHEKLAKNLPYGLTCEKADGGNNAESREGVEEADEHQTNQNADEKRA